MGVLIRRALQFRVSRLLWEPQYILGALKLIQSLGLIKDLDNGTGLMTRGARLLLLALFHLLEMQVTYMSDEGVLNEDAGAF